MWNVNDDLQIQIFDNFTGFYYLINQHNFHSRLASSSAIGNGSQSLRFKSSSNNNNNNDEPVVATVLNVVDNKQEGFFAR
jgi:hypothetical protein